MTAFMGVWNITHVCNPAYCPYQGGIFERSVGMLKAAVEAIRKADPTTLYPEAVSLAVTGRNLSPLLECGLAPLTIMTGRHNVLNFAVDYDSCEGNPASIHVPKQEKNLQSILIARSAVIEYECKDVIRKCLTKNLRAHSDYQFRKDEPVQILVKKQWMGGFRFLANLHHNGIVECGSVIQKIPLSNIRPLPSTMIDQDTESRSDDKNVPTPRDPSSSSRDVQSIDSGFLTFDSNGLICDSDELIFDAEAAYRFPHVYDFVKTPICNSYGVKIGIPHSIFATAQDKNTSTFDEDIADDEQESYDPSRVPPRFYLKVDAACESIVKELKDLTTVAKDGIAPLTIALKTDDDVRRMPWLRSTLVVRKKSSGIRKARLCLRGDLMDMQTENFSSSPTAHRASMKLLISISRILRMEVFMLDVSMAFLQSHPLLESEKCAVLVPEFVSLPNFLI